MNADEPDISLASPDSPFWDKNLYAYCDNNPVSRFDQNGEIWNWVAGAVIGAVAGAALSVVSQAVSGNSINWRSVAASAAAGTVTGLLMATPGAQGVALTVGQTMAWGAFSSDAGYVTYNAINGTKSTWKGLTYSMAFGALSAGFGYKQSNLSACFVAGTLVLTTKGHVPIETIKVGDMVWAENPETGEKSLKRVAQTFIRKTDQFVHIKVDGQKITTTPEHPFWVSQKGWTDAIELHTGDKLVLQNGKIVTIELIQHELLEDFVTVYNFEVEDFHTYYVTKSNILVHNAPCGYDNIRTLNNTTIKGYKVSMDLERGGSGLLNIYLKVGNTKYFWNGSQFMNNGKAIPRSLQNNATITKALNKALEYISKGWGQ